MATTKQKIAIAKIAENGGNVSKAMRDAGYSPQTASSPSKLTRSKGYEELLKKHLPESLVLAKHRALLDKKEILVVSDGARLGSHLENTGQPHSDSKWAVEAYYKLRGKYTDTVTNNILIVQLSDTSAVRYKPAEQHGNDSP